ncbi:hypothetical protein GZH53_04565 [Flavihumibacter sp. R14]|nr:hypothetical protein [Flavihumibacter soli]
MTIIEKLSSSLGRRDEVPNQELALLIAGTEDREAVRELIENLVHKDKAIQSDCMKVLYEIGERKPELISPYHETFISLLDSKNNRLVWGAMTALDSISNIHPDIIWQNLPKILDAADKGSVISKDHAVSILIKLAGSKDYHDEAFILLLGQLSSCPPNQLPMYAENALPVISAKFKAGFLELLMSRMGEFEKESKRKRVEKVIGRVRN